jgi:hypothetical protein
MELSEEFAKEQNLSQEQVTAINGLNANSIADLKKEWDGKANKDAEGILSGAAKRIAEVTGYERKDGQKIADYVTEAWDNHSKTKYAELDELKNSYETKIKETGGSEALTKEYEALKDKVENHYMKIEADYENLKPIEEQYNALRESNNKMKIETSFSNVKPKFSDDVDEYRSKYMWEEFKSEVLNKYTIEMVEGEPIAVDKENPHKQVKLKELVSNNEALIGLTKGRQQEGLGSKSVSTHQVEGVPFPIPKEATGTEIQSLIEKHLASVNLSPIDNREEYSRQFEELYTKARQKTVA